MALTAGAAVRSGGEKLRIGKRLRAVFAALDLQWARPVFDWIENGDGIDNLAQKVWERAGLGNHFELLRRRHRWVTRLLEAGAGTSRRPCATLTPRRALRPGAAVFFDRRTGRNTGRQRREAGQD